MGMILIPCLIFWLIMSFHSLKIGYSLLNDIPLFPHVIVIYLLAITMLALYIYLGLNKFKDKESLWAFQIIVFFILNKITLSIFFITLFVHWFQFDFLTHNLVTKHTTTAVVFIILFSLSLGAIIGTFKASNFMEKHNIKQTY